MPISKLTSLPFPPPAVPPFSASGQGLVASVNQLIDTSVASLKSLTTSPQTDTVYNVIGFYAGSTVGGGKLVWQPSASKSLHNGVTYYAPEAIAAWNGTQADIATLLSWSGSGSGVFSRALDDYISADMAGALGDGVANDTQSVVSARNVAYANQSEFLLRKGSYLYSGVVTQIPSDHRLLKGTFSGGVDTMDSARGTKLMVLGETPNISPQNRDNNRTCIDTTMLSTGSSHGTAVRATLLNNSDDGEGNTAFYGEAISYPSAFWSAAVHGETRHAGGTSIGLSSESNCYSASGVLYGAVIHQTTEIAKTHPVTGNPGVAPSSATGVYILGHQNLGSERSWIIGIDISQYAMKPNGNTIRIQSSCESGVRFTTAVNNGIADVFSESSSANGIVLNGNHAGSALRIQANNKISMEATGGIYSQYNTSQDRWVFNYSATQPLKLHTNLVETAVVRPLIDSTYTLGTGSRRWSEIYAVNAVINTSDDRDKTYIDVTQEERNAAVEIKSNLKKFKWNNAISSKGDGARIHFGASAQTVVAIMQKHGLNAFDYAFVCYDEWDDQPEVIEIIDGQEVITQEFVAAGNRYGIRYGELSMFILGAI